MASHLASPGHLDSFLHHYHYHQEPLGLMVLVRLGYLVFPSHRYHLALTASHLASLAHLGSSLHHSRCHLELLASLVLQGYLASRFRHYQNHQCS